jgi:uncharacterized protein (UPF0332 family)
MNEEERAAYITRRLESARGTLADAEMLFENERYRSAVNRVYYAAFYAVGALALTRGFSTSSHGQLRGYFNREFVKTGLVPVELGKAYGTAFDTRTQGDYDDLASFEREQVRALLNDARDLIQAVALLIERTDEQPTD